MATAAPALKELGKLAQGLPLGEGEGSQGGPPVDQPQPNISPPPPANLAPVEAPPPGMAPGLGTPGGAPVDANSQAKPAPAALDPRVEEVTPPTAAKPLDPRVEEITPPPGKQATKPLDSRVEEVAPPVTPAPRAEAVPASQISAPQSIEDQTQLLISQGKSPGEAKAIATGQEPKTLTGKTPAEAPADIQTDPETGARFGTDPGGQKVPYAEPATAADKAAQPPSGVILPKETIKGTTAPAAPGEAPVALPTAPLVRASKVGETPTALPNTPLVRASQVGDTPVALPTAPVLKAAQVGETPKAITVQPDGSDLPQRIQAVGNVDPKAFIAHNTGGRLTLDGLKSTMKERNLSVQFFMDRGDATHGPKIYQVGGPGSQQILTGWGPIGTGLNNSNTVGMEISANNEKDVLDSQKQLFAKFIAARYPTTQVLGHNEVNPGHKEPDEGMLSKAAAMAYRTSGNTATGAPPPPVTGKDLEPFLGGLLKDKGDAFVAAGKKYNIDPKLLAAISILETGHGGSDILRTRNNVAGLGGGSTTFKTIEDSIEAEAKNLRENYFDQGLDTPEKIGAKWAPPHAPNDAGGNKDWPKEVSALYAQLGGTSTGGSGDQSGGQVAKGGSGGKRRRPGGDTLVPTAEVAGVPLSSPGLAPASQAEGGGGGGGIARPGAPARKGGDGGGGISIANFSAGGGGGGGSSQSREQDQQAAPPQRMNAAPPAPDQTPQQNPIIQALMQRGFSPQQAASFMAIAPGKGVGPPPAAPGPPTQLPAPVGVQIPQQPQMQPAAPKIDPTAVLGLMKRGFTREQAMGVLSKGAAVSQGIGETKQFRPPVVAPAKPAPVKPVPQQVPIAKQPMPLSRPPDSTHGIPNPQGPHAFAGMSPKQALLEHAAALSPDDPRVKKQADGYIKGEHFVEGDVLHNDLLNRLPHGQGGHQRQLLSQAETAIADKSPMHISYISAPKEAAKFPTRDSRKLQYDEHSPEARLMGTTEGQLVGHSMIPLTVGVKTGNKGEPHQSYIQGISTNVLANNFEHINDKLTAMGRKSPYEKLGPKFYNDLEGYYSNLNAGHTATGRGYTVGTDDHPNEPDREHVPYKLSRKEADFIGATINNTAAFAKHDDAKKIRELARVNGTLINEHGETNRMRHDMEEHEPGWGKRVLEPTIRSFKTGLVHEIHPDEEHFPETIRPGKEYQGLTKSIARTSERGRPDIPIAASLHHSFTDNRIINEIERDFSEHRIDEAKARARLEHLGEDPDDYRFIGGSGGLITPYEEDPEALTPEEHSTMKANLKSQWVGGKLNVEDYRRKSAEVPLPQKPSAAPKLGKLDPVNPATPPVDQTPTEAPPVAPKPKPMAPPKPPKPPKVVDMPESTAAPAPDEPLPAKKNAMQDAVPAKLANAQRSAKPKAAPVVAAPEEKLTKPAGATLNGKPNKAWMEDPKNEAERQGYLEKRVGNTLKGQNDHPSAIPMKVQRKEDGGVQHDPGLNPVWEKTDYDIANLPYLQKKKKALDQMADADKHEDTLNPEEHKHLNQVQRSRLSAMREASSVHTMGDHIFESYNKIKDQPDIAAGKGWYSRMRDKMAKAFGAGKDGKASDDHELFAQLLGATSAKTPVRDNFIQALDAFEQHKAGKFDRHIAKYNEAYGALQDGGHKALNQKMVEQGILKPEDDHPKTPEAAMAKWIDHHKITPLKQNGAKFNSNSDQVLKVLAGTWLKEVGAPKTPNFAGNLTGRTLQATIDVWAARHMHRIGNEHNGEKKGWRPQAAAEPGVNDLDFAFSQDAFKHAAAKANINPDDLQAILWYAEKHHWDKKGWTGKQGADKGSFDETWDKAFPTEGKAMTSGDLQAHYQNEKKEAKKAKAAAKKAAKNMPPAAPGLEEAA